MKFSDETAVSWRDRVLVIMAKAPRPGAVKTRLAGSLSQEAATAFYRCLLEDTLTLAGSLNDVEVALMCPDPDLRELAEFAGKRARVMAQAGAGLAAGLTSVFAKYAADGPRRVIAFNSDSPHLPPSALENAFAVLASHDLVVGPTHDGGYYLVGAKASHPTLFANDGMGTASALERLLARARSLHHHPPNSVSCAPSTGHSFENQKQARTEEVVAQALSSSRSSARAIIEAAGESR